MVRNYVDFFKLDSYFSIKDMRLTEMKALSLIMSKTNDIWNGIDMILHLASTSW